MCEREKNAWGCSKRGFRPGQATGEAQNRWWWWFAGGSWGCALTALWPLLLKLVENLYKIRQTYVELCLKGSFSQEREKQVAGCSQWGREDIFHTAASGGSSVCVWRRHRLRSRPPERVGFCVGAGLGPQVRPDGCSCVFLQVKYVSSMEGKKGLPWTSLSPTSSSSMKSALVLSSYFFFL